MLNYTSIGPKRLEQDLSSDSSKVEMKLSLNDYHLL